jgi:mycothiol synthase
MMRPATLDDTDTVVELINDVLEAQVGVRTYTAETLHSEWQSPDFDPEQSIRLVVNEAGRLVGEVSVWDNSTVPARVGLGLNIHPDFIEAPFAERMLRWAEQRARQAIPRVPDHARVVLATGAHRKEQAKQALLTDNGFANVRSFHTMRIDMTAPLSVPALPEGIRIRTFERKQDLQATMETLVEAFRDHWGMVEQPLEEEINQWVHWMDTSGDYDPSLWFIALEGEKIVGLSLCSTHAFDDPDAGYIMELGVLRPWRRRGIASALLYHSFRAFWQRGTETVLLGVDAKSLTGATKLYEKVGMRVEHVWKAFEKELRPGEELTTRTLD